MVLPLLFLSVATVRIVMRCRASYSGGPAVPGRGSVMNRVRALGEVVASIPARLGFVPSESLVLVLARSGVPVAVRRVDIIAGVLGAGGVAGLAEVVGRQDGVDSAVAVVVSERVDARRQRELVAEVRVALGAHGCAVVVSVAVDRLHAGSVWRCLDDSEVRGVLSDPATSVAGVAAVVAGRKVFGSAAELAATVAADPDLCAQVGLLIDQQPPVDRAAAVERVVRASERMAGGEGIADSELAAIAASLMDLRVRDAAVGVDCGGGAEALWAGLARVVPNPYRGEALALLACAAYLRGDGPLARVALEAVLSEMPGHRLALLLDEALSVGLPPDTVRGVILGAAQAVVL